MALTLCFYGHVARTSELLLDHQDSVVDVYLISRDIRHPRRGVHVCAHLSEPEQQAAAIGGVLDCVSALYAWGAAIAEPDAAHLRVPVGWGRVAQRAAEAAPPVVAHWSRSPAPVPSLAEAKRASRVLHEPLNRLRTPADAALSQAVRCCDPATAVDVLLAVCDALLPRDVVRTVMARSPRRVRAALTRELRARGIAAFPDS